MSEVAQLVSSIGFPIVACLLCGYYIKYLTDQHRSEVDELAKAIENNTLVMNRILERLGGADDL